MFNDDFFKNFETSLQNATANLQNDLETIKPRIQKRVAEEFKQKETEQDQINKMLHGIFNGSIIIK